MIIHVEHGTGHLMLRLCSSRRINSLDEPFADVSNSLVDTRDTIMSLGLKCELILVLLVQDVPDIEIRV
jgi:hypothetical protein